MREWYKRTNHCSLPALSLIITIVLITLAGIVPAFAHVDKKVWSKSCVGCQKKQLDIVTTTPLIKDIVSHVTANNARIHALIPSGANPHTFEPSLRSMRNLAYADVAFSNNLLLEEQSLTRAIDTNLPQGAHHVQLSEESRNYGAHLIPLVENAALDTVWLGMRVEGKEEDTNHDYSREVQVQAVNVRGPGHLAAFLTGTFGQPQIYINSADGFTDSAADIVHLPENAHTHMTWAFSKPGIYHLDLEARIGKATTRHTRMTGPAVAKTTVTFAVGVPARQAGSSRQVIDKGHLDISFNALSRRFELFGDRTPQHSTGNKKKRSTLPASQPFNTTYNPLTSVISVPDKALHPIPGEPSYRFLGRPGHNVYMLAQAVLGKHVHGEIDPHVWEDVSNVIAWVKVIRDRLIRIDPARSAQYQKNAHEYIATLRRLDGVIKAVIDRIPAERRQIVTTHDAYGYLGAAYGLHVAGFVTPNPNIEPSPIDIIRLNNTLKNLRVPAVFVEPLFAKHAKDLISAARKHHIFVCRIYGDTFDEKVTSYVQMMKINAYALKTCLDPSNAPPQLNNTKTKHHVDEHSVVSSYK